ncbi:MAG TPA: HRDC domain-containing protein [Myxococcota bacterium]|nr:HRDC domain-containing protein [Myxococcota bacterium]
MAEYPFIQTIAEVEELAEKLAQEKVIAFDTEADSFFHYFDKLCLVQISASCGTFLIDPLAVPASGFDALAPVLSNPAIRKVFHAAEYDLFVLNRHSGLRLRNLFDTMISAQLLGYPAVGYGALVERHFDVRLSKDQQRTDWSRRPLRDVQIDYAAADVRYLVELSQILERELATLGRLAWAQAEFTALEQRVWPEREFDQQGYLRIKGARKLSPRALAVLRELFLLRDKRARDSDRPPFKVMGNGTLLDLAQNPPLSRRALAKRRGITDLVLRRLGQDVVDAVHRGLEGPEHPPLERKAAQNGRRRLDRRGEARLEELKRWRAQRARELGLDPGVFCPNATLEEVAALQPRTFDELRALGPVKTWWAEHFGEELLRVLREAETRAPSEESRPQSHQSHSSQPSHPTTHAPAGPAEGAPPPDPNAPRRKRSRGRRRGSRGGRRRGGR